MHSGKGLSVRSVWFSVYGGKLLIGLGGMRAQ